MNPTPSHQPKEAVYGRRQRSSSLDFVPRPGPTKPQADNNAQSLGVQPYGAMPGLAQQHPKPHYDSEQQTGT